MAKGTKSAEQYQFAGKKKAQVLLRFSIKLPEPLWFRGMRSTHFFQPAWGLLLFFFATGATAKPLRRRIALRFVFENLTVVGRMT
ncbi:hypothetical protein QBJ84_15730 [Vibrio sp. NO3-D2]|nr:hypothetical protein [Vibrio sp. NO3-D2]